LPHLLRDCATRPSNQNINNSDLSYISTSSNKPVLEAGRSIDWVYILDRGELKEKLVWRMFRCEMLPSDRYEVIVVLLYNSGTWGCHLCLGYYRLFNTKIQFY